MDSKFDFYEISFFDVDGFFGYGGKVGTDFVDGDGGWEGKSFEDWFFIIDFGEFFVDLIVSPQAEFEDFGSD